MTHLERSDLTPERLLTLLDAAAIVGRVEEDGDLYLTGEGVDFPLWLSVSPDKGQIRFFTFASLGTGMDDHAAIAYANQANSRWHWCTFAAQMRDGAVRLCADHSLLTTFGIDSRTLIATVRAFAAVFRKAIDRDQIAGFLAPADDEEASDDPSEATIVRH